MSKKKILIIVFVFLIAFLVSGIFIYKAQSNEQIEEIAEMEEQNIIEEPEIIDETTDEVVEQPETEITEDPVEDVKEIEIIEEPKQISQKQITASSKQTSKVESSKVETLKVQETPKVVEQPKQEQKQEQQVVTPPKQEPIYCVDGGKVHIFGDAPDEHGYYNSWNEAFDAYEQYTAGWETSHYLIGQCACGLYYFSATK